MKRGKSVDYWKGWLSSQDPVKAVANLERTQLAIIAALNFTGDDGTDADGFFSPAAFPQKEVDLVIKNEIYTNKKGETVTNPAAQWLNPLGGGQKFEKLEPQIVKSDMSRIGFKAAYLAAKAKLAPKATSDFAPDLQIPF